MRGDDHVYMQVTGLSVQFGDKTILQDIVMSMSRGEVVSIIGPNGAGKTTLLKSLASILPPARGKVWLDGRDVRSFAANELAKKQGYVPQHSSFGFPLTVMETILLGRKPYIKWGITAKDMRVVTDIMDKLQLTEMSERFLDELSGGERQKVLIARALAQEPQVLLLDEPTSALDIRHQLEVLELVRELAQQQHVLVILILHDLELAARYSDCIYLLQDGKIFASGRPEEVCTPSHLEQVYGVQVEIESGSYGLKMTAVRPVSR